MSEEEIKEILNKLSNRKQETLLQGIRECQLKNIEHPFITKEEYIDKVLNYINDLQQENQQLKQQVKIEKEKFKIMCGANETLKDVLRKIKKYIKETAYDNNQYCYDLDGADIRVILEKIDKGLNNDL